MPRPESYQTHDFYCINCGKKAIPIMRRQGHNHSKLHRKKLYCPWCGQTVNHIEVRTTEDKTWFLEQFEKGAFQEEAAISIIECKE